MTKRYREVLEDVEVAAGPDGDRPVAFRWRGGGYRVVSVLGHWREDPGWWRRPSGEPIRVQQTDLWRVEVTAGRVADPAGVADGSVVPGVFEVVHRDAQWKLDRVWD